MAVFKCKMCGGQLTITEGVRVIECDYCGSTQTLPSFDNEKKSNLFNRANNLRLNKEFDKAVGVYESIAAEFPEEAEAYWGLCLCKYGIEYVDDPGTGRKVPTCHRTSTISILNDNDFELAYENADILAKKIYREEAKAIDDIQKRILEVVAKEEPYDIFICYKETDDITGKRSEDSFIAQDIYTELIKEGYKVFFSRVTLRDVGGQKYEPYIYAALSSAKVMLAIGTKYEYYDAVWVKNEWSRYLAMTAESPDKVLLPCCKGMDPYDLPKEFKNLQALDIGSVTFYKDLENNIRKYVRKQAVHSYDEYPYRAAKQYDDKYLISKITSIGTVNENDYWPKGVYSSTIDKNRFPVVMFHTFLQKPCGNSRIYKLHFSVYDEFENTVCDETTDIRLQADNDKIAKGFFLRGNDGMQVGDGTYTVKISLDNSRPFEYSFRVISEKESSSGVQNAVNTSFDIYEYAIKLKRAGTAEGNIEKLDKALEQLKKIPEYKDSEEQVLDIKYTKGRMLMVNEPAKAIKLFREVKYYKDTAERLEKCERYLTAKESYESISKAVDNAQAEVDKNSKNIRIWEESIESAQKWRKRFLVAFAIAAVLFLWGTILMMNGGAYETASVIVGFAGIIALVMGFVGIGVRWLSFEKSFLMSCFLFWFMFIAVPITATREIHECRNALKTETRFYEDGKERLAALHRDRIQKHTALQNAKSALV